MRKLFQHHNEKHPQRGSTLITTLVCMMIAGICVTVIASNMKNFFVAARIEDERLAFVAYEDLIRMAVGYNLSEGIGKGAIHCSSLDSALKDIFDPHSKANQEAPGGFMLAMNSGTGGGKCADYQIPSSNSLDSLNFCVDIENTTEKAAHPKSKKINAGSVRVKMQFINLLNQSPISCDAFKAATSAPSKTVFPGARIFYTVQWSDEDDPNQARRLMQRTGMVYATSISK